MKSWLSLLFFFIICSTLLPYGWSAENQTETPSEDEATTPASTTETPSTTPLPRFELKWREAMGFDTESFKRTPGAMIRGPIRAFQNGLYYYLKYHGG